MTKEETTATWQSWLLDAIHKIRYQKQRPNVERISACIRMHHPQYSNEAVQEHIEMCVANKTISKVIMTNINAGSLFVIFWQRSINFTSILFVMAFLGLQQGFGILSRPRVGSRSRPKDFACNE